MRDLDDLKDLKRAYLDLVRKHGQEATELRRYKQSLLEMTQRHRREAAQMYVKMIARIEKKLS